MSNLKKTDNFYNEKLREFLKRNSLKDVYREVMQADYIKTFIKDHKLTARQIEEAKPAFYRWYSGMHDPAVVHTFRGYQPTLDYVNSKVVFALKPTQENLKQREIIKARRNVDLIELPLALKNASIAKMYKVSARKEIVAYMRNVYHMFKANPQQEWGGSDHSNKGIYLIGSYGVGKTYLLSALANNLAGLGLKVCMIHMPKLINRLSDYINDPKKNVAELIDRASTSDVLILDDIGSETLSAWARDNVLGVILQTRMDNRLFTCFTSNLDMTELENHFKETNQDTSQVKAKRLMERVHFLAKEMVLIDKDKDGISRDYRFIMPPK